MTTDLDLGLRHDDEHPPAPRRRRRRLGRALVLLAVLAALAGIATVGMLGVRAFTRFTASAADYPGPGTGSVIVQVRTGDTATDIAATLVDQGVIKSADAFRVAAQADSRSLGIQPGYYQLRRQMRASDALALLLDPASRVSSKVAIPEGTPLPVLLALIAQHARIPLAQLQAAAKRPATLGLPAACRGQLEGCLFPATYLFPPGISAAAALKQLVARFDQAAQEVRLGAGAAALRLSPYQVLTVASILEKEARLPGDFPKVARVIYNRLARNMPLQLDSTVNYAMRVRKGNLSLQDLKLNSPYNTYLHPGLPPTPISSPGTVALQAALHPSAGPWLYFVTMDSSGRTAFAATYAEFLALRARSTVVVH